QPGAGVGADYRAHLGGEEGLGIEQLAAALDQAFGLIWRLDVLYHPAVGTLAAQLARVVDHALEGPAGGAHALDGHDFVLQREDPLVLRGPAQPRLRPADAPAAVQVLQRVQAEPDLQRLAGLPHAGHDRLPVGPRARRCA